MKRIGLIVALGALAAASAHAAQTFEPAVPRGLPPDSRVAPAGELPQPPAPVQVVDPAVPQVVAPAVPRLVLSKRHGNREADVRQCLRFASNIQIHRCAARYAPHHASVVKTTAKSSEVTIQREDRAKAADLAKPDMSKAAAPAKPVEAAKAAPPAAPAPAAKSAEPAKSAAAPAEPAKPKWTDNAKKGAQDMFTRGAKAADDATK